MTHPLSHKCSTHSSHTSPIPISPLFLTSHFHECAELFQMNIDVAATPPLDIQPVLATGMHGLYTVIWQCTGKVLLAKRCCSAFLAQSRPTMFNISTSK